MKCASDKKIVSAKTLVVATPGVGDAFVEGIATSCGMASSSAPQ